VRLQVRLAGNVEVSSAKLDEALAIAGCRQFDVCVDPADKASVFLYEIYDDRGAFDAHLAAAHFKRFDAAVGPMVASKAVRLLNLVR
jgi:quinol monooxygenase YgiN